MKRGQKDLADTVDRKLQAVDSLKGILKERAAGSGASDTGSGVSRNSSSFVAVPPSGAAPNAALAGIC